MREKGRGEREGGRERERGEGGREREREREGERAHICVFVCEAMLVRSRARVCLKQ